MIIHDSSSNANHGETGGTVSIAEGKIGTGCALFDGSTGYIEIPNSSNYSVPTTGEITVSFWFRPDVLDNTVVTASADGDYVHLVGKSVYAPDVHHEWLFRFYNSTSATRPNRVSFYVFNDAGGTGVGSYFQGGVSGTPTMVAGEWVHVVGKIDATKTYIYRNGVAKDNDVYTATITPTATVAPLRAGFVQAGDADPGYFTGAIDDLKIFNRALEDSEVLALYNGEKITDGLVGWWGMNENSIARTISTGTLGQPTIRGTNTTKRLIN